MTGCFWSEARAVPCGYAWPGGPVMALAVFWASGAKALAALQGGRGLLAPAGDDANQMDDVLRPHDRRGRVRLEVGVGAPDAGLGDRRGHVGVQTLEELGDVVEPAQHS